MRGKKCGSRSIKWKPLVLDPPFQMKCKPRWRQSLGKMFGMQVCTTGYPPETALGTLSNAPSGLPTKNLL